MKITRKQIEVWNKKCGNGFKVNLWQVVWLHKYIRLSPEYLLEVSIAWKTERDFRNKPWAYPVLRFNKWHEKGDLLSSTVGKGYEVRLQEDRKRKNFNDLLEISNADNGLRDEQLIKMFKRLSQEKEGVR
jgi:hypothetical protein